MIHCDFHEKAGENINMRIDVMSRDDPGVVRIVMWQPRGLAEFRCAVYQRFRDGIGQVITPQGTFPVSPTMSPVNGLWSCRELWIYRALSPAEFDAVCVAVRHCRDGSGLTVTRDVLKRFIQEWD